MGATILRIYRPLSNRNFNHFYRITNIWQTERIEKRLTGIGFTPLKERIYQITLYRDCYLVTDTIGQPYPLMGEIVMIIFRNDVVYLICSIT